MLRWSARGQTEPLAALAAVAVVGLALALFAGAFAASVPPEQERSVAADAADRVERRLSVGGVVRPLRAVTRVPAPPAGYRLNVTVSGPTTTITHGPVPPATATVATRRVSIAGGETGPRPGRLEVRVWQ